ncbi:MAG: CHAT domain-containing tetratricopeptide repeat protein [Verrucomicrobiota bacterium]
MLSLHMTLLNRFRFLILAPLLVSSSLSPVRADLADDMEKAIANLRSAGLDQPEAIAGMLTSAAEGYIQRGDMETALERVSEALDIARSSGNANVATSSLFTLSKILTAADDEIARDFMIRELQLAGDNVEYKKALLKVLDMHLQMVGDVKLAVQASYDLWQIHLAENPGSSDEIWAQMKFGENCRTAKMYDLAVPALQEAREKALKLGDEELAGHCTRALALAFQIEKQYDEALRLYSEVVELSRQSDQKLFLGYSLQTLADIQTALGQLDEAEATAQEALGMAEQNAVRATVSQILAGIDLKRAIATGAAGGDLELSDSIEHLEFAIEQQMTGQGAQFVGQNFALLTAQNDNNFITALHLINQDLAAAEATLQQSKGGITGWVENMQQVESSAVMSLDQINNQLSFLRSDVYALEELLEIQKKDFVAALVASEKGRGLAQEQFIKARLGLETSYEEEKEIDGATIAEIAAEAESTLVVYSLVHSFPMQARRFFRPDEPYAHPQSLHIWVISPDGNVEFRRVPLNGPIGDQVEAARAEILTPLENGQPSPTGPAMRALSELLIDPIRDVLPEGDDSLLTIIPQGALYLVPFAALPDADGVPLIREHAIAMSPSISMIRLARQQREAVDAAGNDDVLIVGNPTMPGYQVRPDRDAEALSPLPGAEAEAIFLGQLLGVEPLIGDAATEPAVTERMESARILHFATHGLLETENGFNGALLSSLAFAPSPGEDGFLTARETARMNLRAELAVLSACDTGRGQISGDGVAGLSRGYITAGVSTLVVSLWPVNDAATAEMMGTYYESLESGAQKIDALRKAILVTEKKFPAPSLWAPFIHYGVTR